MLLTTPAEITQAVYEGPLEMHDIGATTRGTGDVRSLDADGASLADRPVATIGEPQWWNVAAAYRDEHKRLPAVLGQLLDDAEFFLVRFACSFTPAEKATIERARFSVSLLPRNAGAPKAISFDLFPLEVYDETQRTVNLKIAPSLKFAETVEASLGEVALEIKYNDLAPVITAVGVQEENFGWEIRQTDKHPLRGVRWLHALLKVPRTAGGVTAALDVGAYVNTPRKLYLGTVSREERGQLTRLICV